jgi:uncharacterized membrane protein YhaH (DUF805 family)
VLVSTLFGFSGTITRRAYVAVALIAVLLKHIIDLSVATFAFHRAWSPLNYFLPLGVPVSIGGLDPGERRFVLSMLAVALPFAWVGVAITVKRFRAIGWPRWLWILFFVPIANVASFLIAAAWPERTPSGGQEQRRWLARFVPQDSFGAATLAAVVSAVLGLACVALGTRVLATYGWGLFAAIPFSEGALAASLYGAHRRRELNESVLVAMCAMLLTLGGLLAVALEGAMCIAMAAPLALFLAFVGALFGYALQSRGSGGRLDAGMLILLALLPPTIMGAEAAAPRDASVYAVRSEIVINASPMKVWRSVISFPDLPPPTEPEFRLGIAYPERAKIVGHGVGAVRYCEFSTGDFVEPITDWAPGKRLAFRVAHNPEPMRELSPYSRLDTVHLHGYMISRRGEFDLEPLAGGRTLLIGTTWYQHHLWPESYWALFSNAIIHRIHMRVLRHIKRLAESG